MKVGKLLFFGLAGLAVYGYFRQDDPSIKPIINSLVGVHNQSPANQGSNAAVGEPGKKGRSHRSTGETIGKRRSPYGRRPTHDCQTYEPHNGLNYMLVDPNTGEESDPSYDSEESDPRYNSNEGSQKAAVYLHLSMEELSKRPGTPPIKNGERGLPKNVQGPQCTLA